MGQTTLHYPSRAIRPAIHSRPLVPSTIATNNKKHLLHIPTSRCFLPTALSSALAPLQKLPTKMQSSSIPQGKHIYVCRKLYRKTTSKSFRELVLSSRTDAAAVQIPKERRFECQGAGPARTSEIDAVDAKPEEVRKEETAASPSWTFSM